MDTDVAVVPVTKARHSRMPWFVFLLVIINLMWAVQGPAIKKLEPYFTPMAMALLPFYIVTPLLLPTLYWKRKSNPNALPFTKRDWTQFFVAGAVGQALAQFALTWGTTRSTGSNFSILNLLIPVITAVLASLMLRERVTRLQVLSLFIGLMGVLLMSMQDLKQTTFANTHFLRGNLVIFAGCAGSAFYNVYCKGLMEKFGEIEILICTYIAASLASLPILLWQEPHCFSELIHLTWQIWLLLGLYCLFVYGISMVMFFYVLKHLPVTVASASVYLLPVFGVLLSMLAGEALGPYTLVGGVVVLTSTVLIMKYDTST